MIVAVRAFRPRLEAMALPRVLITPHLMGRPLGLPGDAEGQRETILAALELLERAERGGTMLELPGVYDPERSGASG